MIRYVGVLAITFAVAACAGSPVENEAPDEHGTVVALVIGQEAQVGDVTLGFVSVPQDSRCPVDVTCVWAGNAEVVVTTVVGGVERVLALNTNVDPAVRPGSVTVDGYTITLRTLDPEPRSDRTITQADYRATFEVVPL